MKKVCSSCGTVMEAGPPEPVTHGLCPKCLKKAEALLPDPTCRYCGTSIPASSPKGQRTRMCKMCALEKWTDEGKTL